MNITVTGIHMDTGHALQDYAKERLISLKKHFTHVLTVTVNFVQEAHHHHLHKADVTVHANGITLRSEGNGVDWHAALDDAAEKLERQLDRYKGRLHKHVERRQKYAEQLKSLKGLDVEDTTLNEEGVDGFPTNPFEDFAPTIMKKDVSRITPMSVDEAVLQMDLLHKPAFLFLNAHTGALNMVYREGDNAVRWIAPKQQA